jgi:hypothetical protein
VCDDSPLPQQLKRRCRPSIIDTIAFEPTGSSIATVQCVSEFLSLLTRPSFCLSDDGQCRRPLLDLPPRRSAHNREDSGFRVLAFKHQVKHRFHPAPQLALSPFASDWLWRQRIMVTTRSENGKGRRDLWQGRLQASFVNEQEWTSAGEGQQAQAH